MKRIPLFDYLAQYEDLKIEVQAALERVLKSGQLVLGPEVRAFEQEFAAFLGGGDAVGVNSGTDALLVALMAVGIGPGDEVITVANTAVATVSAIRSAGARPVFCDVDPATCLMDLARLPAVVTERTRAVVPVHLFGNMVDIPRLREALGGRPLAIIEDCAQAHGAQLHGAPAGTLGDIGAFSFYPTKNLGAYGDGGLCFSRNPELVREMRRIRMYGFEGAYHSLREGINSRLDELQAAVLRVKLMHLPAYVSRRRKLAERYLCQLPEGARPVSAGEGVHHAYHLFVVKVRDRDRVRSELAAAGIDTGTHYPLPIHLMDGYRFLGAAAGSLPQTEALAGSILSLPMYPELSLASVDRVCEELTRILGWLRGPFHRRL